MLQRLKQGLNQGMLTHKRVGKKRDTRISLSICCPPDNHLFAETGKFGVIGGAMGNGLSDRVRFYEKHDRDTALPRAGLLPPLG
jgi:hypothetical protein